MASTPPTYPAIKWPPSFVHTTLSVFSRWDDPFCLVVLEAMASGCAVVASLRGGIPEAAGGAAVLAPSDDPDSVATILREWASQPSRSRGSEAGVRRPGGCSNLGEGCSAVCRRTQGDQT